MTGLWKRTLCGVVLFAASVGLSSGSWAQSQGTKGATQGSAAAAKTAGAQKPSAAIPKGGGSTSPLDINTATADQLKALPGIGDAYAKRIIDGRPYTAKNQLVQRGIIPQNTYDKVKDQIVAHRVSK